MTKPSKPSEPRSPGPDPKKRKPGSKLPQPGEVLNYSYLWKHEYRDGRIKGVKDRPVAVVLLMKAQDGLDHVYVAPMTTQPPRRDQTAIEVPEAVRRQLGFTAERSWIVVDEVNRFTWPGYDIRKIPGREPETSYGFIPSGLYRRVRDAVFAGAIGRPVDRDD
ncbi:hypothetical protein [uncultured Sphingomonas sp.]|uniref:hypothetical protein n=1 Tax=uncultured Sphingomonas sp. TaxID=158754 RepID=UPI0035CB8E90